MANNFFFNKLLNKIQDTMEDQDLLCLFQK